MQLSPSRSFVRRFTPSSTAGLIYRAAVTSVAMARFECVTRLRSHAATASTPVRDAVKDCDLRKVSRSG